MNKSTYQDRTAGSAHSASHAESTESHAESTESLAQRQRLASEQIQHWNGKAGQRWAQSQAAIDQAFEAYGDVAFRRLSPRPGERIVDIGCGSGASTLQLAEAVGPRGEVVGIDVSSPLLEVARRRLSAHPQARFVQADAATYQHPPDQPCNALFSRFGVMFFARPVAAFASLARCLEPGGRLCFVTWQSPRNNPWLTRVAGCFADLLQEPFLPPPASTEPGEFAFADPDHVRQILEQAGFSEVRLEAVDLPVVFSRNGVDEAVAFVMRIGPLATQIAAQPPERIVQIRERIHQLLKDVAQGPLVQLPGAGWVVSAVWRATDRE